MIEKKYKTGRAAAKAGQTATSRLTLRTPKAQPIDGKNSFAAGRPSNLVSPQMIPFATPKSTRAKPRLTNGLASSLIKPHAEDRAVKAPKRMQPK